MAQIRGRTKSLLLLVMLLSVSARVFTGASEAQVNFTSLIVDQHVVTSSDPDKDLVLHDEKIVNGSSAKSLPDKHRTFATYKKYLSPDKWITIDFAARDRAPIHVGVVAADKQEKRQVGVLQPTAHAPPVIA